MAKYQVAYRYFKLDDNGKPKSKTGRNKNIEATSDVTAMEIIKSQHPGYKIEFTKIQEK